MSSGVIPTELMTRSIGVQWAWATSGIAFSPSANAPNMGGNSNLVFPEAALIRGISWQSSVKVARHEILLHFMISPRGEGLGEPGDRMIFSVHHVGLTAPTMITKDLQFSPYHVLTIPENHVVWVYGDGSGDPHPAPVEVQTTLYLSR